jgi:hypothetical protein
MLGAACLRSLHEYPTHSYFPTMIDGSPQFELIVNPLTAIELSWYRPTLTGASLATAVISAGCDWLFQGITKDCRGCS